MLMGLIDFDTHIYLDIMLLVQGVKSKANIRG